MGNRLTVAELEALIGVVRTKGEPKTIAAALDAQIVREAAFKSGVGKLREQLSRRLRSKCIK